MAPSGLIADGMFDGTFDFGGTTHFPITATLDAYSRSFTGSLNFADSSNQYSGNFKLAIDMDGNVSGTWQANAQSGTALTGAVHGFTNNTQFCGSWSNNFGKSGGLNLARAAGDACSFLPAGTITDGMMRGTFNFSALLPSASDLPVMATVQSSNRSIAGDISYSDLMSQYGGSYMGAINSSGSVMGTWSVSGTTSMVPVSASGMWSGITDNNILCGFWLDQTGNHGRILLKR